MKRKEKEQNLLLDQTLMEKNQVVHLFFYLGGCCGHEKKIDTRRQTSQQNSFEEVLYFQRVVWSSLDLHLFTHHHHLQILQSYFHYPCCCLFHHLHRSTHHVGCILLFFISFLFSIIEGPN